MSEMNEEKKVDITTYPEGFMEVVKHMGYIPENDEYRANILKAYIANVMAM